KLIFALISLLLLILTACKSNADEVEQPSSDEVEEVVQIDAEPVEIDMLDYGEEMGLHLEPPSSEVATNFSMQGTIDQVEELLEDDVWIIIRKTESIEEISNREIEYYLPLENGEFLGDLKLPNGEGEYRVTVRIPSTDRDNYYYDAAQFRITNVDNTIARDIEVTKYGLEKELQFSDSVQGYNEATEVIEIEGTVSDTYDAPA